MDERTDGRAHAKTYKPLRCFPHIFPCIPLSHSSYICSHPFFAITLPNPTNPHPMTLRFRTPKNWDVQISCPFACTVNSFACHALLALPAWSAVLICSLTHSLTHS